MNWIKSWYGSRKMEVYKGEEYELTVERYENPNEDPKQIESGLRVFLPHMCDEWMISEVSYYQDNPLTYADIQKAEEEIQELIDECKGARAALRNIDLKKEYETLDEYTGAVVEWPPVEKEGEKNV